MFSQLALVSRPGVLGFRHVSEESRAHELLLRFLYALLPMLSASFLVFFGNFACLCCVHTDYFGASCCLGTLAVTAARFLLTLHVLCPTVFLVLQ
jgi:hypothetical protein